MRSPRPLGLAIVILLTTVACGSGSTAGPAPSPPAETTGPTATATPAESTETAETVTPAETTQTATPAETTEPAETVTPAETAQTTELIEEDEVPSGGAFEGPDPFDGPVLVVSGDPWTVVADAWTDLAENGAGIEPVELDHPIPDFEPFRRGVPLDDGRFLVRGRWDRDEPIDSWFQRNPNAVPPGEEQPPRTDRSEPPIRLFVVDPERGEVEPISGWPTVRGYSTALSIGATPDLVLQLVVSPDQDAVAYTVGFSGAAYDIPYELWLAPIPPR